MFGAQIATRSPAARPAATKARAGGLGRDRERRERPAVVAVDERVAVTEARRGPAHDEGDRGRQVVLSGLAVQLLGVRAVAACARPCRRHPKTLDSSATGLTR